MLSKLIKRKHISIRERLFSTNRANATRGNDNKKYVKVKRKVNEEKKKIPKLSHIHLMKRTKKKCRHILVQIQSEEKEKGKEMDLFSNY